MRRFRPEVHVKAVFFKQREAQDLKDFVEASLDPEFLLHDCYEHVQADRDPDLRLHRVFARPKEGLDAKVLLDSLKKIDLPPRLVEAGHRQRWEREAVGEKHESPLVFGVVEFHSPQRLRIQGRRLDPIEHNRVIAAKPCRAIDGTFLPDCAAKIALGPCHEERAGRREPPQPVVVEIRSIHHIERGRLDQQLDEYVDIVHFPGSNPHKTRDVAAEIQERVQLDRCLRLPESGPREEAQAEVDRGRVQGVGRLVQIHGQRVFRVKHTGEPNQDVLEVGVDLPVATLIGVRDRAPGNLGAEPRVVEIVAEGPQAELDVAEALSVRQLGKSHGEKLIAAREPTTLVVATVSLHAGVEVPTSKKIQDLREHELSIEPKTTLPFPAVENPLCRKSNVLPS